MASLNAYLGFNGNCKEAMTFYKKCLGGELKLMTMENRRWVPKRRPR